MPNLLVLTFRLADMVQGTLLIILRGLGHEAEQVGAFVGTLEKMLQRRRQYHLHTVTLEQSGKLLPAEVDLLEILIEVLFFNLAWHFTNIYASLCRLVVPHYPDHTSFGMSSGKAAETWHHLLFLQ